MPNVTRRNSLGVMLLLNAGLLRCEDCSALSLPCAPRPAYPTHPLTTRLTDAQLNITEYLETDLLPPLAALIDPLEYKENLTMPKLVVDTTGDEFFMPGTSARSCCSFRWVLSHGQALCDWASPRIF